MSSIGGVQPHSILTPLQGGDAQPVGKPGLPPDLKDLLGSLVGLKGQQQDVGQLRADLGRLRSDLKSDIRLLQDQGARLPPAERQKIIERVDRGMKRATELENAIVTRDPKAGAELQRLRHDKAELRQQTDAAFAELNRLTHAPGNNQAAIAKQHALIDTLLRKQGQLAAQTDHVLGMPGPADQARAELAATRNEMRQLVAQLHDKQLPPQVRDKIEHRLQELGKKTFDLENRIVAGNPKAEQRLGAIRGEREKLMHGMSDQHHKIDSMIAKGMPKALVLQEQQALATMEGQLRGLNAEMDQLLGLKQADGGPKHPKDPIGPLHK